MSKIPKPTLPKGTRDFLPIETKKRQYIFDIIKKKFELFGYQPIETPALESLSTLTGKYGQEGDQLLFKVLNNGDFLKDLDDNLLFEKDSKAIVPAISKRGLRYDLTVPFARYLVMNRNEIKLPFKRSAIQPVWRADKPQKGRYQEFYQCDADVAGSSSLVYEAELIHLYDDVFTELNIPITIYINNRKILFGLIESTGLSEEFELITSIIDKQDKIGLAGVKNELELKKFKSHQIETILKALECNIEELKSILKNSSIGLTGIEEINNVLTLVQSSILKNSFKI